MKKRWFFVVCLVLVLFLGCEALQTATPEKPMGSIDPNQVQAWVDVAVSTAVAAKLDPNQVQAGLETAVVVGQTTQTVGMLIGNPAVIGTGILITVIGGILLANFRKKS